MTEHTRGLWPLLYREVHGGVPAVPRRRRAQGRQRRRPLAQDAAQRQIRRLVSGQSGFNSERPFLELNQDFTLKDLPIIIQSSASSYVQETDGKLSNSLTLAGS